MRAGLGQVLVGALTSGAVLLGLCVVPASGADTPVRAGAESAPTITLLPPIGGPTTASTEPRAPTTSQPLVVDRTVVDTTVVDTMEVSSATPAQARPASSRGGSGSGGGGGPTTVATEAPTTSTPVLLVPGPLEGEAGADGTEGEMPTTQPADGTILAEPESESDNTGIIVSLVISGLLVVALVLSLLTYRYWRTTRPVPPPAAREKPDQDQARSATAVAPTRPNGAVRTRPLQAGERSSR